MKIGAALKHYRKAAGLTQSELANLTGLTPAAISNYEQDKRTARSDSVERIAEALNIDQSKLYTYSPSEDASGNSQRKTSVYNCFPHMKPEELLTALANTYVKEAAFYPDWIEVDIPGQRLKEYYILYEENPDVTIKFKPSDVIDLEEKISDFFDNWMKERGLSLERDQFKYVARFYKDANFNPVAKGNSILGEVESKYIVGSDEWLDTELARDAEYKKLERSDDE